MEMAGKQSLKNANVYEKLNALERRAEICNRVSLIIQRRRAMTTGKLLPLEEHTTDDVEWKKATKKCVPQ